MERTRKEKSFRYAARLPKLSYVDSGNSHEITMR